MRAAAEAFDFAREEEVTVTACVVSLMTRDIADYEKQMAVPLLRKGAPEGAAGMRDAGRRALRELDPDANPPRPVRPHPLEEKRQLQPRLAEIDDTAKGLGMLVELCATQPWLALRGKRARRMLRKKPRGRFLDEVAVLLGGDTTQEDVAEIDKVLYRRDLGDWLKLLLPILGGVGIGILTAGFAAPFIGGAIGASMGLSGAAAVNAGLAALGGGSLAAGGLGMAGGTALIGGVGGAFGGAAGLVAPKAADGAAGLAASRKVITDDDFPPEAVKIEARKLEALVARLRVHSQSSQAKAQHAINAFADQIEALKGDLERERRKSSGHEKHIRHLEKKVKLLVEALDRMEQPAPALPSGSS